MVDAAEWRSPIAKFFSEHQMAEATSALGGAEGDLQRS